MTFPCFPLPSFLSFTDISIGTASTSSSSSAAVQLDPMGAQASNPTALHNPNDMDSATTRLVVAAELAEAETLQDDSHGTSDCAMARRVHTDQLLSCRAINQIEEMTAAELARAAAPAPLDTDTCASCGDPLEANTAWQAPCAHWYCFACLETLHRMCMVDEALYPPKCCVVLPWLEVKPLLPADLAASFEQKKAELDTTWADRVYCAQPACSRFLGSKETFRGVARCAACHEDTCTTCKAASHAEPCSTDTDTALQETRRLAHEQGWQSCRHCGRIVDLVQGGCNHMTCPCGHQFCYVCGERWKTCACPNGVVPALFYARMMEEEVEELEAELAESRAALAAVVARVEETRRLLD